MPSPLPKLPNGIIELTQTNGEKVFVCIAHVEYVIPHYDGPTYLSTSLKFVQTELEVTDPLLFVWPAWIEAQKGNT